MSSCHQKQQRSARIMQFLHWIHYTEKWWHKIKAPYCIQVPLTACTFCRHLPRPSCALLTKNNAEGMCDYVAFAAVQNLFALLAKVSVGLLLLNCPIDFVAGSSLQQYTFQRTAIHAVSTGARFWQRGAQFNTVLCRNKSLSYHYFLLCLSFLWVWSSSIHF